MRLPTNVQATCFWCALVAVLFITCAKGEKGNSDSSNTTPSVGQSNDTKFTQYYVKGEQLYLSHCSNCHQKNGTGLGLLFPPINGSDYLTNHYEDVICLMRHGKKGELIVNGKSFNKEMKGIASLTDLEIAEIATYIYNTWGQERGLVDVKSVTAVLNNCKSNP